jgi:hypothetical protein
MRSTPRVLRRSAALAAGYSDEAIEHRIARHSWVRLHPGVYFTAGPEPTYEDRLVGAVAAGGPGAALSGAAALTLWRMRGVAAPSRPLVLTRPRAGVATTDAIRFRRTALPFRALVVNGVRTSGMARSVVDHCLEVRALDSVRAVVSEAVRRRLCTIEQLEAAFRAGPQRGSRNLRIALEDVAHGAWSVPEAVVGRALRSAGVPPFRQNVDLHDGEGKLIATADVYWEDLRAGVEIHGAEHHSSSYDWAESLRRGGRLSELGILVLHVPAVDVLRDLEVAVARIAGWIQHIADRSSRPTA